MMEADFPTGWVPQVLADAAAPHAQQWRTLMECIREGAI